MNTAELFVQCLANEGVRYVFGVPGEENEDLLFALADSSIEFVPCRHEQGAAFIADVWGRLTGHAGVCLSTLGPGATNLVTGVADANLDRSPLVAITGQGGTSRLHHESHQVVDVVNMFRPLTKWNAALTSPLSAPEIVRKAFKLAEAEKPGAVHVELSEDVARREAPPWLAPIARQRVRRPAPDDKAIARAIELLERAERPLVLAGNGAIRTLASEKLTHLVERYRIPVVSTFMGKGAISDRLDQSLLAVGLGFRDYVAEAFELADVIVTVGYDIAEYPPEAWNPRGDKPIVHLDFVPAEVYTHYAAAVEVVGDLSGALQELERGLAHRASFDVEWYQPIRRRILDDIAGYALDDADRLTVPGAIGVVRSALHRHGLVVCDVGSHKLWVARNFPTYCPNGCIVSNGFASMGIALPGAIAAALISPKRPIVAVMGDGGFLMNAQELETARRLGVAFVVLVLNDNDFGLISWKQEMSRGRSVGTRIGNPDFAALAESFGIRGVRVETAGELWRALSEALASRALCLIEAPVDAHVNHELVDALNHYWEGRS